MTDPVEVWLVRTDQPDAVLTVLAATLEPAETARAGAFADPVERRRYVAAHGAVRVVLGRRLGVEPGGLRWRYSPGGKPDLPGGPHWNLSHSAGLALVAVHPHRAVGVDVQHLLPTTRAVRLAHRYYPPAEAAFVAAADPSDRCAWLWTRKEAWVKAAGGQVQHHLAVPVGGPAPVAVDGPPGRFTVADVPAPAGYRAAVALAGPEPFAMTRHLWTP